MTDKVLEILNRDERAKRLNTIFLETAKKENLSETEYQSAREAFLMMMIAGNKEAMAEMAKEVWEHHNN